MKTYGLWGWATTTFLNFVSDGEKSTHEYLRHPVSAFSARQMPTGLNKNNTGYKNGFC
jgi:hypothetical protein